jgi:hypothetical protein
MVFQAVGAGALVQMMQLDRAMTSDWLLFGPTDLEAVEPEEDPAPLLLAAE